MGLREIGTAPLHYWQDNCQVVQSFQKSEWKFLRKLIVDPSWDPTVLSISLYVYLGIDLEYTVYLDRYRYRYMEIPSQ